MTRRNCEGQDRSVRDVSPPNHFPRLGGRPLTQGPRESQERKGVGRVSAVLWSCGLTNGVSTIEGEGGRERTVSGHTAPGSWVSLRRWVPFAHEDPRHPIFSGQPSPIPSMARTRETPRRNPIPGRPSRCHARPCASSISGIHPSKSGVTVFHPGPGKWHGRTGMGHFRLLPPLAPPAFFLAPGFLIPDHISRLYD